MTDPFGRSAALTYDANARLLGVMDQIGIVSSFNYDANGKVSSLTTPYGITSFDFGTATVPVKGVMSWVEVTEPNGGKQRVESLQYSTTPASDAAVPTGMPLLNQYMNFRNSYYWDTKAMQVGAGDYTKANLTHFLHLNISSIKANVIESEKDPLESRIWYFYHNQNTNGSIYTNEGMGANPTHMGSVLDDGSTQLERYSYNDLGNVTQTIDPLGRTTNYTYAANGIDLLTVRQVNSQGGEDLLVTFTWNSQHLPVTITDASGAVTSLTHNARGQLTSVTNALGQTATYAYDVLGRLLSVDGPLPGTVDRTSFTYDVVGRADTVTSGDGYTLDYDYDALDRVTRVTYPDGTYEQVTYTNLDPTQARDRQGRIATMTYDAMQQLVSLTDPLGRVVKLDWCQCGSLRRMIDPQGRVTTWDEDVQGRILSKTYGNGTKETYQYEATNSRLARVTDARGQSKVFSYHLDDTTATITYHGALQPTPGVAFAYDPAYSRLVSMTDGLGVTTYSYGAVNGTSLGANTLKKVKTLWNGVEITYSHDLLGRVTSRAINGVPQTMTQDAGGRVTALANVLGAFGITYDVGSVRVSGVSMPGGQSVAATYSGNAGDRRLQQLRNVQPNATTLSQFNFSYDAEGQITSWNQQSSGSPSVNFNLSYDAARQLTGMTSVGRSYGFTYDKAGNLKTKTIDAATTTFSHNILNELQTASPPLGNDKTYLWDAEDRLVGIQYTGTSFSTKLKYDGLGRCVEITELNGATITSTKRFVWCGFERCEERDASGNVTRRFFGQGEQINGVNYYYAFDHLGSVREMTDASGAVRARYGYDPYGVRTKLSGDLDASAGFTGHYFHAPSGLHLTLYRAYDAQTGRWLSRDPLGEDAGMNLYAYVDNSPVNKVDPLGLVFSSHMGGGGGYSLPPSAGPIEVNGPVSGLANYMNNGTMGAHGQYGPEVMAAMQRLVDANPGAFPQGKGLEANAQTYGSWKHPIDTFTVAATIGGLTYDNDGTTFTVHDCYAFPKVQDVWNDLKKRQVPNHNAGFAFIPGAYYGLTGKFPTPKSAQNGPLRGPKKGPGTTKGKGPPKPGAGKRGPGKKKCR